MNDTHPTHRSKSQLACQQQSRVDRRSLLAGIAAGSLSLAGCLGNDSPPDDGDDAEDEPDVEEGPRIELNGITLASAFPIRLVNVETDEVIGDLHYHGDDFTHWHGVPVIVPEQGSKTIDILLTAEDGERVPVGETDISVELPVAEDSPRGVVDINIDGDRVTFDGGSRSTTELVVQLLNDGEIQYETPDLPIAVE